MYVVLATLTTVSLTLGLLIYLAVPSNRPIEKGLVQLVVLGDIGRSPRMQYHALSIVQHGGRVDLVGYAESEPIVELQLHECVQSTALPPSPRFLNTSNKLLFLLFAPLKVLFQLWTLWRALAYPAKVPEWMLVQNPPSIPTLLLATIICYCRRTKLVIDWHNFGYSVLALKLGNEHPVVKIAKFYELTLGRFAYAHFAVTNAMCDVLRSALNITTNVLPLHDRPAPLFTPLSDAQRTAFLYQHELTAADADRITAKQLKVIVSSTSWTPDEDFSVLLSALCAYSASAISDAPHLPELLVIITGKGPLKQHYQKKISQLEVEQKLEMVTIKTAWLSFEDYATLLGAADLGVSLHTSSSGVDLPMKVVDMFGAGLPVLGYNNFRAWPELVHEDVNGKGFANAEQMATVLKELCDPSSNTLASLKEGALRESERRWSSEWDPVAGKLFGLRG